MLLIPAAAAAQEADLQRFRPALGGTHFVKVEALVDAPTWELGAGLWADRATDPFVYRPSDPDADEIALLESVTTARLTVWGRLAGRLRVGFELPGHANVRTHEVEGRAMGDLRLAARVRVVETRGPVWAAGGAYADLSIPTGTTGAWVAAGAPVGRAGLLGTLAADGVVLTGSVGMRTGTGQLVGHLEATPAIEGAIGAAVAVDPRLTLAIEADGAAWWNAPDVAGYPAEILGSLRLALPADLALVTGLGTGLSPGLGAPDLRVVAGLTWRTAFLERPDE